MHFVTIWSTVDQTRFGSLAGTFGLSLGQQVAGSCRVGKHHGGKFEVPLERRKSDAWLESVRYGASFGECVTFWISPSVKRCLLAGCKRQHIPMDYSRTDHSLTVYCRSNQIRTDHRRTDHSQTDHRRTDHNRTEEGNLFPQLVCMISHDARS